MSEQAPKYEFTKEQIASSNAALEEEQGYIGDKGGLPVADGTRSQLDLKDDAMTLVAEAREHAERVLGGDQDWATAVKVGRMYNEAYSDNERFDRAVNAKEALSEQLHENWRDDIEAGFVADGKPANTPRLRPSKDKTGEQDAVWFAAKEAEGVTFETDENGSKLVNTNVAFDELPPSWKAANSGAANFVVDTVVSQLEARVDITQDAAIENAASEVHERWMRDNSWQQESRPDLFVPYDKLSESEKKKDRDQVLLAIERLVANT